MNFQLVRFFLHQPPRGGDDIFEHRLEVERLQKQFHFARLDFGDVEDVVDEREQMLARAVDFFQVGDGVRVAAVCRLFLEHFAVADDGVERRAQLVAHVREELALGVGGGLRLFLRLAQLRVDLVQLFFVPLHLAEHFVEAVNEKADFVVALFHGADGIIFLFGNLPRHLREIEDGFGDHPLQPRGKDERHQQRADQDDDSERDIAENQRVQVGQVHLKINCPEPLRAALDGAEHLQLAVRVTVAVRCAHRRMIRRRLTGAQIGRENFVIL